MGIHYQIWRDIKTASDLKYCYEAGNGGHFFERSTLKFFGDSMRNYGITKHHTKNRGLVIELRRKNAVKHGLKSSVYFYTEGASNELTVKHTNRDITTEEAKQEAIEQAIKAS